MAEKEKQEPSPKAEQPSDKTAVTCAAVDLKGQTLTTDQGVRIENTDNSLKGGLRGPSLMEDFHLREKITHFDHERIPERVVHARGAGAHGYFETYKSMAQYTRAHFLQKPGIRTPVFVRFSTVAGSRGSSDTVRDVRGFAVKFYTQEGNFDLVGNNIPIFFIQDGIKFPDIIHAAKPEPNHEIPQASTAHDSFWDFMSLTPETTHMAMWILSDRAIPQSFRMMEGFGVHTFRFTNNENQSYFVKFHWKPILGLHSLVWDEALKIAGSDPDFHRRDLWEAIDAGNFPEYEFGVQIIEEKEAGKLGFDLFDATKIVPEEIVPVVRIGKMILNRNTDNFFAETEQVAFHVGNLVPGIDVTNDPLMQARLFSYIDTQLTRLGGPNFAQIPINQPIVPVHNNQQDGFMRYAFYKGRANYLPNSIDGGCPFVASLSQGGYHHYPEPLQGMKIRERSPTFADHFSQAALFWNSLSLPEKQHLLEAARFELGKVSIPEIRERMVGNLARANNELAEKIAAYIGVNVPQQGDTGKTQSREQKSVQSSAALSMANTAKSSIQGRKIAVLVEEGFAESELNEFKTSIEGAKGIFKIISSRLGSVKSAGGQEVKVDFTFFNTTSVLFQAVFVPGGAKSVKKLAENHKATCFLGEAYCHYKPICLGSETKPLLQTITFPREETEKQADKLSGIVFMDSGDLQSHAKAFIEAVAKHRFWERTPTEFKES